jgi:hypothetical protein
VHRHLAFISAGGAPLRVIRAVAANSGFYTLPTFEIPFPFGFGGTESVFSEEDLRNYLQACILPNNTQSQRNKDVPSGDFNVF